MAMSVIVEAEDPVDGAKETASIPLKSFDAEPKSDIATVSVDTADISDKCESSKMQDSEQSRDQDIQMSDESGINTVSESVVNQVSTDGSSSKEEAGSSNACDSQTEISKEEEFKLMLPSISSCSSSSDTTGSGRNGLSSLSSSSSSKKSKRKSSSSKKSSKPKKKSDPCMKRIRSELAEIMTNGGELINAFSVKNREWIASVCGPKDTPYDGGKWFLSVHFGKDYPFQPPSVKFKTKIYHCNVDHNNGAICLDILKDNWSPVMTVYKVMLSIMALLQDPNPADPLVTGIAQLYLTNKEAHDQTAKEWTLRYATNSLH